MIRSKISTLLRNSITQSQPRGIFPNVAQCRFNTNNADSTKQTVPDKLYKKIEIEMKGHDKAVLLSYTQFLVMAAKHLNITIGRNINVHKPVHERLTVLKSAFVHKKHRVQYETRTYFRYIDFVRLTGSTADTFLEYIERNLPEGVALKVTKVEIQKLPESIANTSLIS